jgi:hypothetical protein
MLVAFLALLFAPISWLVRHRATWGPAEQTENMLSELRHELSRDSDGAIALEKIERQLELPKFAFLKKHIANDIELWDGELIWFSPNTKYSIGLNANGGIVWMVNGKRPAH